jgi:hypothetical protein
MQSDTVLRSRLRPPMNDTAEGRSGLRAAWTRLRLTRASQEHVAVLIAKKNSVKPDPCRTVACGLMNFVLR